MVTQRNTVEIALIARDRASAPIQKLSGGVRQAEGVFKRAAPALRALGQAAGGLGQAAGAAGPSLRGYAGSIEAAARGAAGFVGPGEALRDALLAGGAAARSYAEEGLAELIAQQERAARAAVEEAREVAASAARLLEAEQAAGSLTEDLDELTLEELRLRDALKVVNQELGALAGAQAPLGEFFAGLREGAEESAKEFLDLKKGGSELATELGKSMQGSLSNLMFHLIKEDTDKAKQTLTDFLDAVLKHLTDFAARLAVGGLLNFASTIFKVPAGARGGLILSPTLLLAGEKGPEVLIPLEKLGEFLSSELIKKSLNQALSAELAAQNVGAAELFSAGQGLFGAPILPEAVLSSSSAMANAVGAFLQSAAIPAALAFLITDAIFTRGEGVRSIGAFLFGQRGARGLVPSVLGALGFGAFRKKKKKDPLDAMLDAIAKQRQAFFEMFEIGNFIGTRQLAQLGIAPGLHPRPFEAFRKAIENLSFRISPGDIIRALAFAGDVKGLTFEEAVKRGLPGLSEYRAGSADAAGRFVRRPALRLVGEAGPEHILNVDSPASVRALREGLRPVVRELFAEERRAGARPAAVHLDLRGAFFPDARSVERLFRLIEDFRLGRRLAGRPA